MPEEQEIHFSDDEIIVSKTDLKGRITYANDVFCRVAEMRTEDVLGQPHNLIRHPDMPRVIFKRLWDSISSKTEIFAYIKNRSRTGKYYWVLAHVTPSYKKDVHIGYHSNRRKPKASAIAEITTIYADLLTIEAQETNRKTGLEKSTAAMDALLSKREMSYSEFIWSLSD